MIHAVGVYSDVDIKLQAEFNNKWNRIRAIWGVLAKSERDEMERLLDEVLPPWTRKAGE